LCQELSGKYLNDIKEYFNLNHIGSGNYNTSRIRNIRKNAKRFGNKKDKLTALSTTNRDSRLLFIYIVIGFIYLQFKHSNTIILLIIEK